MKTYQEKMRGGIRWFLLKNLSKICRNFATWAAKRMIKLSRDADKKDCEKYEREIKDVQPS